MIDQHAVDHLHLLGRLAGHSWTTPRWHRSRPAAAVWCRPPSRSRAQSSTRTCCMWRHQSHCTLRSQHIWLRGNGRCMLTRHATLHAPSCSHECLYGFHGNGLPSGRTAIGAGPRSIAGTVATASLASDRGDADGGKNEPWPGRWHGCWVGGWLGGHEEAASARTKCSAGSSLPDAADLHNGASKCQGTVTTRVVSSRLLSYLCIWASWCTREVRLGSMLIVTYC